MIQQVTDCEDMMVDFLKEQRLSLTELARQEGVSIPTPWRWTKRGVKGVVLETFSIGGRRYTTQEAFRRFVERSTSAANRSPVAPAVRTNRQRETAIARAERELEKAGI